MEIFFTNIFNAIYNQQINKKKVGSSLAAIFIIVAIFTVILSGVSTFKEQEKQVVKKEIKKPEIKIKKEEKNQAKRLRKRQKNQKLILKKKIRFLSLFYLT